jgi:RHS repeat-associated protein
MKLRLLATILFVTNTLLSQNYHDTQGKLDISNAGQATYTLPIALPPSIKNVGPVINLVYASGQQGGIAGQGWNISSISAITRMATRKDIEGFVDGVDFDDNDKLALDGQRLILKTGTYWANGSTYQTEVQSNAKIELKGAGTTLYFIVTSPDGSRSWYGNYGGTNAVDLTAFYITRFEDTNGNYVTYHYAAPFAGSLCINEIKFSGNVLNLVPINSIKFNYVQAARKETAYIKGLKHIKTALLSNVEVKTNSQLFRKYQLTHFPEDGYGYQRVQKLQEFNGLLEAANPVFFEYNTTPTSTDIVTKTYVDNLNFNEVSLSGDFDGDGRLDFVANSQVYTNVFNGNSVSTPIQLPFSTNTKTSFAGTLLSNSKLEQKNSIINIEDTTNGTIVNAYKIDGNTVTNIFSKTIPLSISINYIEEYTTLYLPNEDPYYVCGGGNNCGDITPGSSTQNLGLTEFLEGDFNGDGVSEILIQKPSDITYIKQYGEIITDKGNCQFCNQYSSSARIEYYILDLNSQNQNNDFNLINNSEVLLGPKFVMDFNGDGKSDIFKISGNSYKIYSLKQTIGGSIDLEVIGEGLVPQNFYSLPRFFGDYNGDGKTDIMIPEALESSNWIIYYSNPKPNGGNFFDIVSQPIITYHPTQSGNNYEDRTSYHAMDVNKDGKTDLVSFFKTRYRVDWYTNNYSTEWQVKAYTNNIGKTVNQGFLNTYDSGLIYADDDIPPFVITSNFRYQGMNTDLVLIRSMTNKIDYYRFNKNFNLDNTLKKVTASEGNIVDEIEYKTMELGEGFYSSNNSLNYPYVEINNLPTNYLVSKLKNTAVGITKYQDFIYNGMVVNMHGLGSIGFMNTARSAWYLNSSDKRIWSVTENNPLLRGATTRTYSQLFNPGNTFLFGTIAGLINSDSNSFTSNTSNNVYSLLLNKQTTTDYITGVTNEVAYAYDTNYLLPTSTTNKNFLNGTLQGTTTTTNEFENNVTGVGVNYYIGRPKSSTTESTAYGNTIKARQEFAYTNNRLIKTKKRGNTIEAKYLVEDFMYDAYGNMIKKTLSTEGYTGNILNPRSTEYTYDTSGRFVTTVKDVEGLITTNNIFHPLYGIVLTTTNPFGLATTSEIDNWGKVKKVTDYLGKSINYTYAKTASEYIITTIGDDGSSSIVVNDALGRLKKSGKKNIDDTWSYKNIEYDFLGRKYRESEPYSSGSPTLWSTSAFDDYNRVITSVTSTGLTTNIVYNGTTVTGNNGYKTTSSTKNANGHVVSASDNGGIINYTYYADGSLKTSNFEGTVISMTYDEWNRKKTLSDPSAGNYGYTYYPTGEARTEETPNGVTTYNLDPATGKLLVKAVKGNLTNSETTYNYNATSKLLDFTTYNDVIEGTTTTYTNIYDAYQRIIKTVESNPTMASFEHQINYDLFGRIEKELYKTMEYATAKTSSKWIKNTYKNGAHWQILEDATQKVLWQTNTVNARGQLTGALLGNGINIVNTYDQYGFCSQIKHYSGNGTASVNVMVLDYNFNTQRGLLNSRSNKMFDWVEDFTYDNLERLTSYTNAQGVLETQVYDNKGRITENNIGKYKYNPSIAYQNSSIEVSTQALPYYQSAPLQTITYNVFKSPVSIAVIKADNIDFVYNAFNDRSAMYYGDIKADKQLRPLRKYYAADGSVEIKHNKVTNVVEFLTYIGGDGYSAPTVLKSDGTTEQYLYLHRDNQGTILAVSDATGLVLEKRLFDAWGNIVKVQDKRGKALLGLSILDRGYTGHEHLQSVGLIHMNGRLYDPKLHRFLQPDNFVQEPYNTQNYNRYGYVFNNPLKYTDPSGEYGIAEAIIVGAIISASIYTIKALINNTFDVRGLIQSSFMGAFSGAVTFGVGQGFQSVCGFTNTASGFWSGAVQGAANGFVTGIASTVVTGTFNGGCIKLMTILKGGLVGAGIGGLIGAVRGGVDANNKGLNFWNGSGAVEAPYDISLANMGGNDKPQYSNEYAKNFVEDNSELNRLSENVDHLYADGSAPLGYTSKNGQLYNGSEKINGVMIYQGGFTAPDVYLSNSAFVSRPQLYLTIHHEYMHATFYTIDSNFSVKNQHKIIHQWQYDQVKAWGPINRSLFNNSRLYTDVTKQLGLFPTHYSHYGFRIINYIP